MVNCSIWPSCRKVILVCYKHSVNLHVPTFRLQAVAVSLSLSLLSSDIYELHFVNSRRADRSVIVVTVIVVSVAELLFVLIHLSPQIVAQFVFKLYMCVKLERLISTVLSPVVHFVHNGASVINWTVCCNWYECRRNCKFFQICRCCRCEMHNTQDVWQDWNVLQENNKILYFRDSQHLPYRVENC